MKLGVMIEGQEGLDWQRWQHLTGLVEALGFESVWRSDHFFSLMGHPERNALETWISLAELAARGTRLRFGALVNSMTFRHPALLARMAAGVDALSGGKLVVGVGAGWNVAEHEAFGIPFPPVKERMDRLEEGIEVLLRLWSGEPTSFDGRYFPLKNARALPAPAQRPRPTLLVGGSGEKRTLRIVATYADEWNAVNQLPEAYRAKVEVLERHCAAVGRDVRTISRSMMCAFIIGRSEAEIRNRVTGLQQVMPAMAAAPVDQVPGSMRARGWLVGTPADVVEQLKLLEREGVERVMLQHHNQTDDSVLELIANEVLPAVAG